MGVCVSTATRVRRRTRCSYGERAGNNSERFLTRSDGASLLTGGARAAVDSTRARWRGRGVEKGTTQLPAQHDTCLPRAPTGVGGALGEAYGVDKQ